MARNWKGKHLAPEGKVTFDFGLRAGSALDHLIPGPHRDKTVARMFDVSVRMAKYLRAGQYWTADRLSQASAVLGAAFDAALYSPVPSEQHYSEMAEITARLARLETRIAEMDSRDNAGLASPEGGPARTEGGNLATAIRTLGPVAEDKTRRAG